MWAVMHAKSIGDDIQNAWADALSEADIGSNGLPDPVLQALGQS